MTAVACTREALRSARDELANAGCETPALDAEVLLADVLGVERAQLFIDAEKPLPPAALNAFRARCARRVEHEPVAYITGRRGFRLIELDVDRRVLIPRPETELLVEIGLELPTGSRVLDVGTGSGAVALALKSERPDLDVSATDASSDALAVAQTNAGRLGLDVTFALGDLLAGLEGEWDAVLANLPYVAMGERAALPRDVAEHEPPEALFAGHSGLEVVARLVTEACGCTHLLATEVGMGQAPAVERLMSDAGFPRVMERHDLAGIARAVVGRR